MLVRVREFTFYADCVGWRCGCQFGVLCLGVDLRLHELVMTW